jgi:hypothetical protein
MRVEVLGGLERRRRWSHDDKVRIVEETLGARGEGDGGCAPQWHCGERGVHLAPTAPDKIANWVVTLNEWRLANYRPMQGLDPGGVHSLDEKDRP